MAARAAGNGDSFALDRSRLGSSHSWKAMPSLDGLGGQLPPPVARQLGTPPPALLERDVESLGQLDIAVARWRVAMPARALTMPGQTARPLRHQTAAESGAAGASASCTTWFSTP